MRIDFMIGDLPAKLLRDPVWGGMKLHTSKGAVWLQHPLQPSTHVWLRLKRRWELSVEGHAICVEKTRPAVFGGLRPQSYRVFVDGGLVADTSGF